MKTLLSVVSFFILTAINAQNFIVDQFVHGGDWSDEPIKTISANNSVFILFKLGSGTGTGSWNYESFDCGGSRTLLVKLDETGQSL